MKVVEPIRADPVRQALENASEVSRLLERTANALAYSARLAGAHAERQQRAGLTDLAQQERRAAERAGEAADHAHLQAAKFGAIAARAKQARPHPSLSRSA